MIRRHTQHLLGSAALSKVPPSKANVFIRKRWKFSRNSPVYTLNPYMHDVRAFCPCTTSVYFKFLSNRNFWNFPPTLQVDIDRVCYIRHNGVTLKKFINREVTNTMIENYKQAKFITYQFIAFETGESYHHPSEPVPSCGFYDGRVRPWYKLAEAPYRRSIVIAFENSLFMSQRKIYNSRLISIARAAAFHVLGMLSSIDRVRT